MKLVTEIVEINKKRSRVFLDEEFAFTLYKGELLQYGIEQGAELSEPVYEEIMKDCVIRRAKLRALHMLETADRTEQELRRKLKADYPAVAVDAAAEYVKSYRYVDDGEYARRYVEANRSKRSMKMLSMQLEQKGIDREVIEALLAEGEDIELQQLERLIARKLTPGEHPDLAKKQKLIAALMRKGYGYDKIRKALENFCEID